MKTLTIETVRDLKSYLSSRNLSPERFGKELKLSHMTIRRWLKKEDSFEIPLKYRPILESYIAKTYSSGMSGINLTELMESVEESGRNYPDDGPLEGQLSEKLKNERFDQVMVGYCKKLLRVARSKDTPLKSKAICIGALLYFINPIDLIPDHIPVIGYLDDFVVLSVAVNAVSGAVKDEEDRHGKVVRNT
jgi:uncharacterized membrane protein YkvA (DUF1232 family)